MVHPVQPFFALSANTYHKCVMQKDGIVHFYEFTCHLPKGKETIGIPDGCIDIIFDLSSDDKVDYSAGTVLKGSLIHNIEGHQYFGVRFASGITPDFLDGKFQEFTEKHIPLSDCLTKYSRSLPEIIREKKDFVSRIKAIRKNFPAVSITQVGLPDRTERHRLVKIVRQIIRQSDGAATIKEISEQTGYTSRYIDKVFTEAFGISPKKFSVIVRFQAAIDHLDHDNEISISNLALMHGYYDQPQFARSFKAFTLMTPRSYRQELIRTDYLSKFILTDKELCSGRC